MKGPDMTAIPTARGGGVQLICDGCGRVAAAVGCGLHDADVVYVAVAAIGWAGSAFTRGPHRCPACRTAKPPATRSARRSPPGATVAGRVSQRHTDFATLVDITGNIDVDVVAELRTALDRAVAARPQVIVGLAQVRTIDPAGLGVLVRARRAARGRNGDLVLAGPSRFVRTVLRTMRLHTAFRTFGTVQQAMTAAHAAARHQPHSPSGGHVRRAAQARRRAV
jgi:anti-anti-sigma factor